MKPVNLIKAFILYIDDQYDDISVYEQLRLYCDDLSWIEDDEYYFLSKNYYPITTTNKY